jgi:hypothetical protein
MVALIPSTAAPMSTAHPPSKAVPVKIAAGRGESMTRIAAEALWPPVQLAVLKEIGIVVVRKAEDALTVRI